MKFRMTKTEKALLMAELRQTTGIASGMIDVMAQQLPAEQPLESHMPLFKKVVRNLVQRLKSKRTVDVTKLHPLERAAITVAFYGLQYTFEALRDRAAAGRFSIPKYYALARVALSLEAKVANAGIPTHMRSPQRVRGDGHVELRA